MNRVNLIGRLTKEPEVRVLQSDTETKIATFTLAVDRHTAKAEQTADFITIKAWNKKADFAEKYLKKGTKIALSGRIETGSYTNKDGVKVYTTDVVAEEMEFCESKSSSETKAEAPKSDDGFMSVPDNIAEELPFN